MEAVYSMVIHDLYQNGLYVDEDTLEYVSDINMKHVRIQGSTGGFVSMCRGYIIDFTRSRISIIGEEGFTILRIEDKTIYENDKPILTAREVCSFLVPVGDNKLTIKIRAKMLDGSGDKISVKFSDLNLVRDDKVYKRYRRKCILR